LSTESLLSLFESIKSSEQFKMGKYGWQVPVDYSWDLASAQLRYPLEDFAVFFITGPEWDEYPIHKDGHNGAIWQASLFCPLIDCDDSSITTFYEICEPFSTEEKYGATFLKSYSAKEVIAEFKFQSGQERWYLFNSGQWHSIENKSAKPRVVFTWRFRPQVYWSEALELIKPLLSP
jgi:hypothetical protein